MLIAFPVFLFLTQLRAFSSESTTLPATAVSDSKAGSTEPANGSCSIVPRSYGHKTTSHGMKGLNVRWQWQGFGGTLKLSEALAVYCCSGTVPSLVLWFVATLWDICWYGNSYFPSTSLLKTTEQYWQNQSMMIFCGPKSPQRFRH